MATETYFRPRGEDDEPEKILVVGHQGAGKSTAWLNIAKRLHETGSPARVYVLDLTREVKRMLEADEFSGLLRYYAKRDKIMNPGGNIDLTVAITWEEISDWIKAVVISRKADVGDWVVIEMAGNAWKAVTDSFTRQTYGMNTNEFVMDAREKMKSSGKRGLAGLDRNTDWNPINCAYSEYFAHPLFMVTEANVLVTTGTKLLGDNEKEDVRKAFGGWGRKPAGQGDLGFQCHSLIELSKGRDGFEMDTIKDRGGREYAEDVENTNFALDYLVERAHWKWGKVANKEDRKLAAVGAEE